MRLFVTLNEEGYVTATLSSQRVPGEGGQLPANVIELTGQEALFRQIAERPGFKLENGQWVEPASPSPVLQLRDFFLLFTQEEVLAIAQARPLDPAIEYFWTLLTLGQSVDLGHPYTATGLALLVSKNLLTAQRAAAIAANERLGT